MYIERLDHLVLTVRDIDATVAFYVDVLGMRALSFDDGRRALGFGRHKINLHAADALGTPHARHAMAGTADLCFVSTTPMKEIISQLGRFGVAVEQGPVARTGVLGPMMSVYFRDPDGNLIEVANDAQPTDMPGIADGA
ncbi:VOC family protein [Solimonas marina]|uniref:VOC family protein n=1 Tax=Solimonas marina TaxID=2714601 RepID=A0A969WCW4_9GAMM|nr:VOC family protein [Solimonas marina]NKF23086.1 VOC family protein [Solimonas marina]